MREISDRVRKTTLAKLSACARKIKRDKSGNIALTFALVITPMLLAVGSSLDYMRAYNTQSRMQSDLDSALLASVGNLNAQSSAQIKQSVEKWFAARTPLGSNYTLTDDDISIDITNGKVLATVKSTVPTMIMQIAGFNTLPVTATSTVGATGTSYIQVFIVFDKSASMLVAADPASQATAVNSQANCVFACHDSVVSVASTTTVWIRGRPYTQTTYTYPTYYDYMESLGVVLRADVQLNAARKVLDMIKAANASINHIKLGFYTLGTDVYGSSLLSKSYKTAGGIHQIIAPTYSSTILSTALDTNAALQSSTSYQSTDFRALNDLASIVGTSGSGKTESDPMKLVMLITDGAQSSVGFIHDGSYQPDITPMNPAWCNNIKSSKAAKMAVLYTEYLQVPPNSDDYEYYMATLGKSMLSSNYNSVWKAAPIASSDNSTVRRDYIATALSKCASSDSYFLNASSTADIENGFSLLLSTYLGSLRLTQ